MTNVNIAKDVKEWLATQEAEQKLIIFSCEPVLKAFLKLCDYFVTLVHIAEGRLKVNELMEMPTRRGLNLLLCGLKGSGKTTLCQGLVNYTRVHFANVRAIYHNVEQKGMIYPSTLLRDDLVLAGVDVSYLNCDSVEALITVNAILNYHADVCIGGSGE